MNKLSILQWNVWYKESPANILKFIKNTNADIICLQEITQNREYTNYLDVAEYITKETGYFAYFEAAYSWKTDKGTQSIGNMILSRYPLTNCKSIFIQSQDKNTKADASNEGRLLLFADIELPSRILTIATTHMSYTDRFIETEAKLAEEQKLLTALRRYDSNLIFTGDLNVTETSKLISELSTFLVNAGPDLREKTWTTKPFSYYGFLENELNWRLDYVFTTSDISVLESSILETEYSDHLPILTQIEV